MNSMFLGIMHYVTTLAAYPLRPLANMVTDDSFDSVIIALLTLMGSTITIIWSNVKLHKNSNEKLETKFRELKLKETRTELNQAIDHDYGVDIVVKIYTEYKLLGGNSYMTNKVKEYIERKTEEIKHD